MQGSVPPPPDLQDTLVTFKGKIVYKARYNYSISQDLDQGRRQIEDSFLYKI